MPNLFDFTRLTWFRLHYEAGTYPETATPERAALQLQYLENTAKLFPCGTCGAHMAEYMAAHPPQLGSRGEFERWTYDFHNSVNASAGKPTDVHSFEDVQKYFRSRSAHERFGGYYTPPLLTPSTAQPDTTNEADHAHAHAHASGRGGQRQKTIVVICAVAMCIAASACVFAYIAQQRKRGKVVGNRGK